MEDRLMAGKKTMITNVQQFPPCPSELSQAARAEWDRIVAALDRQDTITELDTAILGAYCTAYASWLEAEALISKFGAMIKSPTGRPMPSPYVAQANKQREAMMRCASELGLTPASRLKFPKPSLFG
jgi:P27 family predicted phage terminase small subunit